MLAIMQDVMDLVRHDMPTNMMGVVTTPVSSQSEGPSGVASSLVTNTINPHPPSGGHISLTT